MVALQKIKLSLLKKADALIMERPTPVLHIGAGKTLQVASVLSAMDVLDVFIVTDQSLMQLGLVQPLLDSLASNQIRTVVFADVTPDPTYAVVHKGLALIREHRCSGIVAMGGGSVLDCAKAIAAAYSSNCEPESMVGIGKVKKRNIPFVVIPTTAGTGSEVTVVSVISNTETHKKTNIIDGKIIPDVVVLDAALTVGLPPHITSTTAIDALTHALEAYVSRYANERTDGYAEVAIRLIFRYLKKAMETPSDLLARESLLIASFYAGMSFTRTYIGYVHAFAHNIGGRFGIPHGLANAVILPHVMKFYLPECRSKYARLAEVIGIDTKNMDERAKAEGFLQHLDALLESVSIPEKLEKFPKDSIDEMIKMAFQECHPTYPVPAYMNKQQAYAILDRCAS